MTIFDVIQAAGGIALFLYGMNLMGNGLERLAGGKLEKVLQSLTSNIIKSVLLGTAITAVIQSSTATTVIVIGLVNSGIMQLSQAIGIIMGANIGTTVTSQILRLSDLSGDNIFVQLLKPSSFAPVLALVGVVLIVFFKDTKRRTIGQMLAGFGILFIGMMTMEESVAPLSESPVFLAMFSQLQNPVFGILAGAAVTAILQSSSASVGILQALSTTGAVTWGSAIPIILGQNIGTCSTGLISAAGASKSAKRVAFTHLYFNVIGSALFIGIIYGFKAIVGIPFWGDAIDRGGIADFHTLFNLLTTLLFIPFNKGLIWLAEKTVPDKPEDEVYPELTETVLDRRLFNSPALAIARAYSAVEQMATVSNINQRNALDLLLKHNEEKLVVANQRENLVDKLDVGVSNYLVEMTNLGLSDAEGREVTMLLNFVTEFERIGDYAMNIIERSGEVHDKEVNFSGNARKELETLSDAVSEVFEYTIDAFVHKNMDAAIKVEPLEEVVDILCTTLRDNHIQRLKKGECSIDAGIIFLEVLTDYERISDHCSNVAARLLVLAENEEVFDPHSLRRTQHAGGDAEYDRLNLEYQQKYLTRL